MASSEPSSQPQPSSSPSTSSSSSPGRFFRRYENHPRLQGFVKGITAAAAGAIAGAAIVIARQTIAGVFSILIGLLALGLLLQRRVKIPEPALVAVAALVGLALHDG